MKRLFKKKIIKKEISLIHFLLLTTSKLLIGVGIGLMIATHYWYVQPYWFILILIGAIILLPILYYLMMTEGKEEIELKNELKK